MMEINRGSKGVLISIEGPDGAGKTTQAGLLEKRFQGCGREVLLTREPGGTCIGEEIRKLLLNPIFREMSVICEALLYSASRSQLVSEVIKPALKKGSVVICDRFLDSSLVYQGFAGGQAVEMIRQVNSWATQGLGPDLTILLDLDAEVGLQRSLGQGGGSLVFERDRMEQKELEFHDKVRTGFLNLALREPQRIYVINACDPPGEIHDRIWGKIQTFLNKTGR